MEIIMTAGISDSLMLAILSMDAYNRNDVFRARVKVSGDQIGNAVAGSFQNTGLDGFAAQAYTWDGKTVIAYRPAASSAKRTFGNIQMYATRGAAPIKSICQSECAVIES
jgi:hypothetical protein